MTDADRTGLAPALTPEEWADFPNWPLAARPEGEDAPLYFPTRHGIAAANLHGQPFGFTREDVARCLGAADRDEEHVGYNGGGNYRSGWRDLAARIEALLPPAP